MKLEILKYPDPRLHELSKPVEKFDAKLHKLLDDMAATTGSALLGLSIGCARCHDHKFDPIPQADYYRFRALFEPALDWKNWRGPRERLLSLYTAEDRAKAAEIDAEAAKVMAERETLQTQFIQATLDKEIAKLPEEVREPVRQERVEARVARDDFPGGSRRGGAVEHAGDVFTDLREHDSSLCRSDHYPKPDCTGQLLPTRGHFGCGP